MSVNWAMFGYNFSLLVIMVVSLLIGVSVWFGVHKNTNVTHAGHVDTMAGDEGDD